MYKQIALYIILFAANLSILQSIIHLISGRDIKKNLKVVLIFLCMGIFLFQERAVITEYILEVPNIIFLHNTLLFLLCYLLIVQFADRLVVDTFRKKHLFFFVLMAVSLTNDIYIFMQSGSKKIALLENLFSGQNNSATITMKVLFALAGAFILFYLLKIIIKTASIWKQREYTAVIVITFIYTFLAVISIVLTLTGYIGAVKYSLVTGVLLASIIIIFNSIIINRYPGFLTILKTEVEKKNYNRSLLETIDTPKKLQELENNMREMRPYLDEECSLQQIAEELELTPHQLSQLINEHLQMNFNSYINQFRIEEACTMLIDEKTRPVLSVAYAVGFNSKSSFYESFSKITGKTPKQYRKEN